MYLPVPERLMHPSGSEVFRPLFLFVFVFLYVVLEVKEAKRFVRTIGFGH